MADLIKVIILGIVEGITEFLPISSTGHLIVASALLDFQFADDSTFEIFIQLGAIVAVVGFYRFQIWEQVRTVPTDQGVQHFWLAIIIASIPAAIMGFTFGDWITENLFSPTVVAISLIIGGIAFIFIETRYLKDVDNKGDDEIKLSEVTFKQALMVGVAQTLALIPGVSRSGASIFGGLFGGMNRSLATTFSFYLSIPVLGGATIVTLLRNFSEFNTDELMYLVVGAIVSGIIAWFAIGWLLRYVARNNFITFGYYRIIAGIIILLLVVGDIL